SVATDRSAPVRCATRPAARQRPLLDARRCGGEVSFLNPSLSFTSFDHLVGAGGQRQWDSDAKRLGGLEVNDQLDLHLVLNRRARRFGTFENPPSIGATQPIGFSKVGSIAHQPARSSEPAIRVNRRNGMTRREHYKSNGAVREQVVGTHHKGYGAFFC